MFDLSSGGIFLLMLALHLLLRLGDRIGKTIIRSKRNEDIREEAYRKSSYMERWSLGRRCGFGEV